MLSRCLCHSSQMDASVFASLYFLLSFRVFDCEFTVTAIKVESRALSSSFFFVCVCGQG